MAVVADPVAKAQAVKTRLQAARLHQSIEAELALSDNLPAGWESDAERALSILEAEYDADELRDATVSAGDRSGGFIPSISSGAKRGLEDKPAGDGSDPRGPKTSTGRRAGKAAGGRAGGRKQRASGRRSSPRRSGRLLSSRTVDRTGIPKAADSATGFVLSVIGGTVGLVLLYSLLTGRGPQAAQLAGNAFVGGLRAFIAPTDPLGARKPAVNAANVAAGLVGAEPTPAPGNAYERGVAAGELAGPPAPGLKPRQLRPVLTPGPGGTGNRPN